MRDLEAEFGAIDIYLFDQLLRGRITRRDRIVDAGCGGGRNLVYLWREGFDVWGLDADPDQIRDARRLAETIAPGLPADRLRVEPIEQSTLAGACATVVISSAVLHFARDDAQFDAMVRGTWRLLAPGGMLFCRLASSIGMESRIEAVDPTNPLDAAGHRCRLPDGTVRYLVDEPRLMALTRQLGGQLLDPLKTTVVQDQRAMTTWVVRKGSGPARREPGLTP
jgi:tellurite methyltransferase